MFPQFLNLKTLCVWNQKSEKFTWNKKLCDICVCETKKTYQKLEKICDLWNQKLKENSKNQKNFVTFEIKNQNNFLTLKTLKPKKIP